MSNRFTALVVVLATFILTASTAALWVGVSDFLLASAGGRRHVEPAALPALGRGWYVIDACVRHDLAVVVTADDVVYRLGERGPAPDDGDRTYTPLAAASDCDDDRPPSRVYALLEDAEGSETTLSRSAPTLVAPPPIRARVEGTVGVRVGDRGRAAKALRKLGDAAPGIDVAPLLHKGGHPPDKTVSMVTTAAGLHGLLLFVIGALYVRRRARRRADLVSGRLDDAEDEFFRTETLD
jgi:hypothetical protein